MPTSIILDMTGSVTHMTGSVTQLTSAVPRRARATAAGGARVRARRPASAFAGTAERAGRSVGRAWINGREVGGTDPGVAHLGAGFD